MAKYLCIILMGLLCPLLTQAQHARPAPSVAPFPVYESAKELWNNPVLKNTVLDSLNKRTHMGIPKSIVHPGVLKLAGEMPASFSSLKGLDDLTRVQFLDYVNKSMGPDKVEQLKKGYELLKDTARISNYLERKLRGFYAWKDMPRMQPLLQAGAYDNHFKGVSANAFYDNTPAAVAKSGFHIQLEDQLIVGNIPFNIRYTNLSGQDNLTDILSDQSLAKVSFDKEAYLERMSKYVKNNYDLDKYFLADIDVTAAVKSFATNRINNIKHEMEAMLPSGSPFNDLLSADQLIHLDSAQIKQVLLSQSSLGLQPGDLDSGSLTALYQKVAADSTNSLLAEQLQKVKATHVYLDKIRTLKQEVGSGLAVKETLSKQNVTHQRVSGWLNDAGTRSGAIKELLPLGFFQRLMMNVKNLNIGNIAASGSI